MLSFTKRTLFMGIALAATLSPAAAVAELRQITIGTNPPGSSYNAVGTALAKVFVDELGIRATAQPYAGTSVFLPLINAGEVTAGLTTALQLGMGSKMGAESVPTENVRIIARLWGLPYGYMVRKDSGIETVSDLKGKRVVVELKANRHLQLANEAILEANGLSLEDVTNVPASGLMEGIHAVEDGNADATAVGLPMGAVKQSDATVSGGINIVGMEGKNATQAFFNEAAPGLTLYTATKGAGVEKDKQVINLETVLVTSSHVSDEDVKKMLAAVVDQWPQLQKQFGFFRSSTPEDFLTPSAITAPFHAGAVAYYKEKGLWTEAAQAQQDKLQAQAK